MPKYLEAIVDKVLRITNKDERSNESKYERACTSNMIVVVTIHLNRCVPYVVPRKVQVEVIHVGEKRAMIRIDGRESVASLIIEAIVITRGDVVVVL